MDNQQRDKHRHSPTRLGALGNLYLASLTYTRELSAQIERHVQIAKTAGNSSAEISRAAGLSEAQIDYIVASVHLQQQGAGHG